MYGFSIYHGTMLNWSAKSAQKNLNNREYDNFGVAYVYRTYTSMSYYLYMLVVLLAIRPTLDVYNGVMMMIPTVRFFVMWSLIRKIDNENINKQKNWVIVIDKMANMTAILHMILIINNYY